MKEKTNIQYRYIVCFILFFNIVMFYVLRTNVSVGILTMVEHVVNENDTTNPAPCLIPLSNNQSYQGGQFKWDHNDQGLILSSFYIGYIFSNFAGVILAEKIGYRILHSISIAGVTFFTFLMVPMAYAGIEVFIFGRFLIGLFSGPLYPLIHLLIGHWAPLHERTLLTVATYSGNIIGLIVTFLVGGFIVEIDSHGWEYLFYFSGALGILNLILWLIFGYDNPEDLPFISEKEVELINKSVFPNGKPDRKKTFEMIPFKELFSSYQLYINCLAHAANAMVISAYLTGLPKYLSDVFGLSAQNASNYSIIAFVFNFVIQVAYSFLTDYIRKKDLINISVLRKINSGIAFTGSAIFLIPVGFLECRSFAGSIALLTAGLSLLSLTQSGYFTAMIDISPKYGGIIMGISNTVGSITGIAQPQMVGKFLTDQGILIGWRNSYIVTACLTFILGLPFIIFGSSKRRKWADGKLSKSKLEKNDEKEGK